MEPTGTLTVSRVGVEAAAAEAAVEPMATETGPVTGPAAPTDSKDETAAGNPISGATPMAVAMRKPTPRPLGHETVEHSREIRSDAAVYIKGRTETCGPLFWHI